MKLSKLINGLDATILHGDAECEVHSLCCDSRKVQQGEVFLALKGTTSDGLD